MKRNNTDIQPDALANYYPAMLRTARRILRSEADAQDVVQDVMMSVLDGPHLTADIERLGGWLVTVVYRRAVDLLRKASRRKTVGDVDLDSKVHHGPGVMDLMAEEEVLNAVIEALDALDDDQRYAFIGNAINGTSFRDLSEESGIPMGTLMARKKRAVDSVRRRLQRQGLID